MDIESLRWDLLYGFINSFFEFELLLVYICSLKVFQ
jgi:hypothetical protein